MSAQPKRKVDRKKKRAMCSKWRGFREEKGEEKGGGEGVDHPQLTQSGEEEEKKKAGGIRGGLRG